MTLFTEKVEMMFRTTKMQKGEIVHKRLDFLQKGMFEYTYFLCKLITLMNFELKPIVYNGSRTLWTYYVR
jgi:hypothetical protein